MGIAMVPLVPLVAETWLCSLCIGLLEVKEKEREREKERYIYDKGLVSYDSRPVGRYVRQS